MRAAAELVGLIGGGLFTGGTLFAAVVEHPARMSAGMAAAVAQFRPSYRRAAVLDVGAAALTLVACVVAAALGAKVGWLIGGLVIGVVVPLTFMVIVPVERDLERAETMGSEQEMARVLHRWGRRHEVRTAIGVAGFVILTVTAVHL